MTTNPTAPRIRVFEPALCCNTGVCGPDLDQSLVEFTADLGHLQSLGVDIARHNLANDPTSFANTPAVAAFLRLSGSAGLPLVLVDDVTVAAGRYPGRDELLRLAGTSPAPVDAQDLGLSAASGCCGGGAPTEAASGCC